MVSQELLRRPTEYEGYIDLGKKSIDLTIVYNFHGDERDAVESVDYVEPNSLVFIEGFTATEGYEPLYESELESLNELRFCKGLADPIYLRIKEDITRDIENILQTYEPSDANDFTRNALMTIKLLLEKNCVIYYADFKLITSKEIDPVQTKLFNEGFRQSVSSLTNLGLSPLLASVSIGKAMLSLKKCTDDSLLAHAQRENAAVNRSLARVGYIKTMGWSDEIHTDESGQIKTYMTFGVGHKFSLTQRFINGGVIPKLVEVKTLSVDQYLETVNTVGENYNRILGYAALRALSYFMLDASDANQLIEEAYPYLESLNDFDKDDFKKFIVTCALIARELTKDVEQAFDWYLSLLRSFMPSPIKYVRDTKDTSVYLSLDQTAEEEL